MMNHQSVCNYLLQQGSITSEQLQTVSELHKNDTSGKSIEVLLFEHDLVQEEVLLEAYSIILGMKFVSIGDNPINAEAVRKIPKNIASKYTLIAVDIENDHLVVLVNDPFNFQAIEDVKASSNMPIEVRLARKNDILGELSNAYAEIDAKKAAEVADESAGENLNLASMDLTANADDTPVVTLVNSILYKAYTEGASDIHIEPFEHNVVIRIRVDGQIVEYLRVAATMHSSLAARIKIMGGMDIAEKRIPQDGHFRAKLNGIDMNLRVSTLPTVYGEKAVLRFVNQDTKLDNAESFGMLPDDYEKMMNIISVPHGIVYVTGPTGSGKTTTLYMVLEKLAKRNVNITTIEDPVERHLEKINQTQVNNLAGMTFEKGLRSILRQDPDIVMIGETRDIETASISVRAALTGHLVLSTLHTNDSISSVTRLLDMGIESFMLASSLTGIMAQRLAKKICNNCKEAYYASEEEKRMLNMNVQVLCRGRGCEKCNNTGYKGRIAIHEIFQIDPAIAEMISSKRPIAEIQEYVVSSGKLKTLRMAIANYVVQGITTIEELLNITHSVE